jgi:hypothetical protein
MRPVGASTAAPSSRGESFFARPEMGGPVSGSACALVALGRGGQPRGARAAARVRWLGHAGRVPASHPHSGRERDSGCSSALSPRRSSTYAFGAETAAGPCPTAAAGNVARAITPAAHPAEACVPRAGHAGAATGSVLSDGASNAGRHRGPGALPWRDHRHRVHRSNAWSAGGLRFPAGAERETQSREPPRSGSKPPRAGSGGGAGQRRRLRVPRAHASGRAVTSGGCGLGCIRGGYQRAGGSADAPSDRVAQPAPDRQSVPLPHLHRGGDRARPSRPPRCCQL